MGTIKSVKDNRWGLVLSIGSLSLSLQGCLFGSSDSSSASSGGSTTVSPTPSPSASSSASPTPSPSSTAAALTLSPSSKSLMAGNTATFSAGGGTSPFTYSVTGNGSINSSSGVYTAGAAGTDTVKVTDSAGKTATSTVTVSGVLSISPSSASLNLTQNQTFTSSGGVSPVTLSVYSGSGSINSSGLFSRPWASGSTVIRATDAIGNSVSATVTLPASALQMGLGSGTYGSSKSRTAVDGSGNIYHCMQSTTSLGSVVGGAHGSGDIVIAKFDSSGNYLSGVSIGAGSGMLSECQGMAIDSGGNIFVSGTTYGQIVTQLGTHGTTDYFVAKLNSSYALQWAKQRGVSTKTTEGWDLALDGSSNAYVVGFTNAASGGLGTEIGTHGSTYDQFLAKYDTNGNEVWVKQIGGASGSSWATGVFVDTSVYVAGYTTSSSFGTQVGVHGSIDYTFSKYDTSGNQTFSKQFGASGGATQGYSLAADGAGNYYIAGTSSGSSPQCSVISNHGQYDVFVAKLDSSGTQSWCKQIGSGSSSVSTVGTVVADSSGNAFVTGYSDGSTGLGGSVSGTHGAHDGYILGFNTSGTLIGASQYAAGSSVNLYFGGIAISGSSLFVSGCVDSSATWGYQTGTLGPNDLVLGKWNTSLTRQ